MNKNPHWVSYILLSFFATALVTAQWAGFHTHLAEQHEHNGVTHQHQAKSHAHDFTPQSLVTDYSHLENHVNIIEVDSSYLQKRESQEKSPIAITHSVYLYVFFPVLREYTKVPIILTNKLSYLSYSSVNPRAPPYSS